MFIFYCGRVGRRERRWQLNYYRDMHWEYLIEEHESCACTLACVYASRAYTSFVTGMIGQSPPPVGTIKPELIHVFVNLHRSTSCRLVNRGPRAFTGHFGILIYRFARAMIAKSRETMDKAHFAYRLPSTAIIREYHRVTLRKYTFTQKFHVYSLIIKSLKQEFEIIF